MKRAWVYGALALMVGMAVSASADAAECRAGQKFGKIGSVLTANGVITSSAARVRLLSVSSTTSAGIFGIYDTTGLGTTTAGTLMLEPTAAANGTTMLPPFGFFDPPLEFDNGITVVFSNGQSATAFGCIDR